MREFFYYFRHQETKAPQITVCLLHDEEVDMWHRGVSICSLSEQANKKRGRAIARGRAMKAIKHGGDVCLVLRGEAVSAIYAATRERFYSNAPKGQYNTTLTLHEHKLLGMNNDDRKEISTGV